MRRQAQILCVAGAAVVAGGTLWAIASSDVLGRFGLSSPSPTNEASLVPRGASGEKVAAVSTPKSVLPAGPRRSDPLAIEIARIEAGGASVIAGRSPPNHRVIVLANGREVANAVASDEGQWSVIVSEGIAAGPLELSVSAKPANGGPAVVSVPRHLVVPQPQTAVKSAARTQPRVAEAPPAKVWAPSSMGARAPAAISAPANVADAPAERILPAPQARSSTQMPTQSPARSTAKAQDPKAEDRAEVASDKRALERFAALVERARTDAAAAKSDSSGSSAPAASPNAGSHAPGPGAVSSPAQPAAPAVAMRAGAQGVLPDPEQVPIPVPITFVTDETELTPHGARAAALLAEYLRLKRPEGISLSGHADSRGPDGYNMELSKRRLEAIEQYLRKAGYTGNLSLTPKGKREPYLGIDRTRLSLHEVYQADRRVELRLTQ
jgi:outer membrane protein OmpA-like peptidoglycan-associated protein